MIYRMGCFPPDKIKVEDLEKASGMVSEILGLEGMLLNNTINDNVQIGHHFWLLNRTQHVYHRISCNSRF